MGTWLLGGPHCPTISVCIFGSSSSLDLQFGFQFRFIWFSVKEGVTHRWNETKCNFKRPLLFAAVPGIGFAPSEVIF
jgi:hypothetical protein